VQQITALLSEGRRPEGARPPPRSGNQPAWLESTGAFPVEAPGLEKAALQSSAKLFADLKSFNFEKLSEK
jgi:hypothetical protein